jgi:hypothetical protein
MTNARIRIVGLCLALALLAAAALHAQGTQTATLTGKVVDAEGAPLPGVTVTATAPVQMGARTATTSASGEYTLYGLAPGSYTVSFALDGFHTVEAAVDAGVGITSRADVTLQESAVAETIVVTAEAPSELENTSVGANFTANKVNDLPIVNRTPVGIAGLAGSVTQRTPVAGQLSINGGMAYDNSILINGVNVMDPIFGTSNNLFIEDAVAETQILTSGISAEYGHFTGGVLNVVTKSGGNDFSGSLRTNLTKPEWRDETPFEESRNTEREGDLGKAFEATFGGFLWRDRAWFFLAGRDEENTSPVSLPVTAINVARVQDNRRYELKLNGNLTPSHSLHGSYVESPLESSHENQLTPIELDAMARNSTRENEGFAAGYTGVLTPNLLAEARYSEKVFTFINTGGTSTNIFDSPIRSSTRIAGNSAGTFNGPYFDGTDPEDRNNEQLYGALSYFLTTGALGSHDIKGGAERFTVTRTGGNSQSATNYVFYTGYANSGGLPLFDASGELIPVFTSAANGRRADDSRIGLWLATRGAELDVTTDSFFIHDRWTLNDHWTFNLGVRHERVRSEATGGITGVDTDNTVPRVGASFDPLANGKWKLDVTYAEYAGRYNPSIIGANTVVGRPSLLYGYYVGPSGQGDDFAPGFDPANYVMYYAAVPTANIFMADGLSSPVNAEITLSAGMALPKGGYAKLTFIDRELSGVIDDFVTIDQGCTNVTLAGINAGCVDNVVYRNSDVPQRTYQALQLQGAYRLTDHWSLEGNYTHQLENDGTYEGEGGQSIGATPFGNRPETQSPRVNPDGRLAQYQEHKLRLWTIYDFDLGRFGRLGAGLIYRYDSPRTYSFSTSVPLSAAQLAANPGYRNLSGTQTLFFGERGLGEFESASVFDVSLNYSIPVFKRLQPWIKVDVTNVLNEDALTGVPLLPNTGILANTGNRPLECGGPCPVDGLGLPTTFRPASNHGTAAGAESHETPREYRVAAGFRF